MSNKENIDIVCAVICHCTGHDLLSTLFIFLYVFNNELTKAFVRGCYKTIYKREEAKK